uniref:Major allergen Api g 1, isoallergen 1 n=1 Tax=Apium graveolens TaxID=4045 RepID=ALL1_APIGR|nr:RecName: Full=Major allergen Api g 1, isoallergen 1; AltName: Full=Allergen Api g 1.0101; AltName: Full=Allergen Api g I; AltName: Allergen=Api g 1 [Apium graveolens]2BK0_A Chain A, MAJOR ALLERGEN API G 1 [Apium graveolens]2BK0_B Chain B, MAJOR ALLERGEN API G 1 [Apium graveolens]CAA88831.1 Api g 1 (major allergen from celery) [Apium graveolens]
MGVQTHVLELTSSVSAEKIFQGFVIDVDTVLPKAAPGAYKSVEIKGDGGPGTLKIITLPDGGPITTMTLRIDGVNKEALTFDYSVIDGDILLGFIESIENHVVLVPTADGGSICKTTAIFHTKGDAVVPEENIKYANEQNTALFKALEAYLIAN